MVIEAVWRSLTELADAGVFGISDRALMTAKKWTRSRDKMRRVTGNLAFLMMAATCCGHRVERHRVKAERDELNSGRCCSGWPTVCLNGEQW